MFNWFKKKERPKRKDIYLVAYACDAKHCSARDNDGICSQCGEPVRNAVCKGHIVGGHFRIRLPYSDGFVRWLEEEIDATGLTRLRDEKE